MLYWSHSNGQWNVLRLDPPVCSNRRPDPDLRQCIGNMGQGYMFLVVGEIESKPDQTPPTQELNPGPSWCEATNVNHAATKRKLTFLSVNILGGQKSANPKHLNARWAVDHQKWAAGSHFRRNTPLSTIHSVYPNRWPRPQPLRQTAYALKTWTCPVIMLMVLVSTPCCCSDRLQPYHIITHHYCCKWSQQLLSWGIPLRCLAH